MKRLKHQLTMPLVTIARNKERDDFPVDHLSSSSLIKFGSNPIMFKINEIQREYIETTSRASTVLGKGFHKSMEAYRFGTEECPVTTEGEALELGLKVGMEYLENYNDGFIEYNKDISCKQKLYDKFTFLYHHYVTEKGWDCGEEALYAEHLMKYAVSLNWRGEQLTMPVPLKGYTDLIFRQDGKLKIKDYKTVKSFSDLERIDGAKIIAAITYYLLVYAETGEEPYSMVYEEIKHTKNKDGSPQIRTYEMVYAENDLYFDFFFRYYSDVVTALNGEQVYVPNVYTMFDNEVSIVAYINRLDHDEETAKLMKRHRVDNITDLLRKRTQKAKSMRKFMETAEKQFINAKAINYDDMKDHDKIKTKLMEHGMVLDFEAKVEGNTVDLYRYNPSIGLSMKKIKNYAPDIEQVLGKANVRILAPEPGTNYVSFEVPREKRSFPTLPKHNGTFELALGETTTKDTFRYDIREAPHMFVAGSTGGGKSVFICNLIDQLIVTPNVDLHLFDPKRVELSQYKQDAKEYQNQPAAILKSLLALQKEMERRYQLMEDAGAKHIRDVKRLRYKFIVIDEYAELAMKGEVGNVVQSLAQLGRAAGMHVIIATQRASTKVISGDIKVNFPTKAVFKMSKKVDSTVMLDEPGAEKLLGKGDMLFAADGSEMIRLQGYKD
jgi:hypothetical protein